MELKDIMSFQATVVTGNLDSCFYLCWKKDWSHMCLGSPVAWYIKDYLSSCKERTTHTLKNSFGTATSYRLLLSIYVLMQMIKLLDITYRVVGIVSEIKVKSIRSLPYKYLVYELSFSSNKFLAGILHAEKCQVKQTFSEILLRLFCFSCDGRLALSYHLASSFSTKLPLSHANWKKWWG